MIVSNLCKSLGNKELLNNINFSLNSSDKVGLIGKNGSGKSTLLKILSGNLMQDSGKINLNGKTIKLLKQEIEKDNDNLSVIDYVKSDIGLLHLEDRLHKLENNLNENNMDEYSDVFDEYLKLDGYNFENNLNNIINGLNLDVDLKKPVRELSGGQKIKILLASLLLSDADILLLDEPTNNLDIDSINWLEIYLKKMSKEMIIVSHDETFLNEITNKIFELSDGKFNIYNMSYSDYLFYKECEYNKDLEKYNRAKEQQKKIKSSLEEAKQWANQGLSKKKNDNDKLSANFSKERTKKTSSKISKLTKELEKVEIDQSFRKKEKIDFCVDYINTKGNRDIYVSNLVCGYKDFSTPSLNLNIPFGTRLCISGKNGSGKSTFIKTLLNIIPCISGTINIGNEVKMGYISQDSLDGNSVDFTVYEYLVSNIDTNKSTIFNLLNKFHIKYDDKDKLFSSLSPGERTRVNLAKLAINETNVLVLDEATNHLDIEAINVLEQAVESFTGTIISISHNRAFNDILNADMTLNIETGSLTYKEISNCKKKKK